MDKVRSKYTRKFLIVLYDAILLRLPSTYITYIWDDICNGWHLRIMKKWVPTHKINAHYPLKFGNVFVGRPI
jgi:hypothetical protein